MNLSMCVILHQVFAVCLQAVWCWKWFPACTFTNVSNKAALCLVDCIPWLYMYVDHSTELYNGFKAVFIQQCFPPKTETFLSIMPPVYTKTIKTHIRKTETWIRRSKWRHQKQRQQKHAFSSCKRRNDTFNESRGLHLPIVMHTFHKM